MNSVQILGSLTREPELKATRTGKAVARITVAVSRSYSERRKERADRFHHGHSMGQAGRGSGKPAA